LVHVLADHAEALGDLVVVESDPWSQELEDVVAERRH
jgi:hypothetical protein